MTDLLYRKKPVVIEAMQFQPVGSSGEDAARVESWCGGEMVVDGQGYGLVIETLEGRMRASPGDWIIRGVAGEFYPCKPDIFEQTYESAALRAVQPGHVNETPKSEHDERVMLAPNAALFRGPA